MKNREGILICLLILLGVCHTGSHVCPASEEKRLVPFQADEDELDCPTGKEEWLPERKAAWGSPYKAFYTVPPQVRLGHSTIPDAGHGIFTKTFLPRFTWLAEYEGEVVKDEDIISDYAWAIWRNGEIDYFVDAFNLKTSNWLRWINCARHVREQNVISVQCTGKIFYVTSRAIRPGEELFVYYGEEYAKDQLDIPVQYYYNMEFEFAAYKQFPCWNIA